LQHNQLTFQTFGGRFVATSLVVFLFFQEFFISFIFFLGKFITQLQFVGVLVAMAGTSEECQAWKVLGTFASAF